MTVRRAFAVARRPAGVLAAAAAPAAAATTAPAVATRRTTFLRAVAFALGREPPDDFFGAGRLAAAALAGAALRAELFFAPPPFLAPPFFAPPAFFAVPPLRDALAFAAVRFAGAALLFEEAAPFFEALALDFFEEADALAEFDDDLDADFDADFFDDLADALPPELFFADDFFALFFDAAIWFLLFKSFGWGAVLFDERTSAALCITVHELHPLQCRRT